MFQISNNYYNAAEMSQYATEHGLQSLDMVRYGSRKFMKNVDIMV